MISIRPIEPSDKALLRSAFDRLSAESRYRRFLSDKAQLTDADLRYLTEVDGHDHVALVAVAPGGDAVGVARFIRAAAEPESAEAAIAVVDDWQRRGIGKRLLDALAERARQEGVRRFTALVLPANRETMTELFERVGAVAAGASAGAVELRIDVEPHDDARERLRHALRAAATGRLALALARGGWRRVTRVVEAGGPR